MNLEFGRTEGRSPYPFPLHMHTLSLTLETKHPNFYFIKLHASDMPWVVDW